MRFRARIGTWYIAVLALSVIVAGSVAVAEEIVLGGMCDRTGPTKNIGLQACRGGSLRAPKA